MVDVRTLEEVAKLILNKRVADFRSLGCLWMVGKWRPAFAGCNGAGRQLKPARLGTAGQQPQQRCVGFAIPRRQQIMSASNSRSHVRSGLIA